MNRGASTARFETFNQQRFQRATFNDTNWLTTLGYWPRACSNTVAATSFVNASPGCNCVSLDSSEPAFLQYEVVQEDGHANVTLDAGTLLWWYQPNWTSATNGSGPGTWAPLIEVGRWSSNFEYGCFAISIDRGGTNLYVEGQTNGARAVYLQAPIHWSEGEWHQIAVTYDTNSALYIDGVLATNGPAIAYRPSASECAQDGLFIGSEATGTLQARGQFESMRTLNYAMPADCIQGNYSYTVARYWPLQSGSSAMAPSTDSGNGGINSPLPMDAGGGSSGGLTLGITVGTNQGTFVLTLYGTQAGNIYQVLTNTDVASLNWQVLTNVMGSTNPISFTISNGASAVFFKAKLRQPENGAVWLTLADGHTSMSAIVNGVSNCYSAFFSTIVETPGPVFSLNMGYGANDGGLTTIPNCSQQNVIAVSGLTSNLTNFCASTNPIISLDLHGLTGLQDIECFQCSNLANVNVTNCPSLTRACFGAGLGLLGGVNYGPRSPSLRIAQKRRLSEAERLQHMALV